MEELTGYDPFPRIFHHYEGKYPVVASSDAHQIRSFLGTKSFLAALTLFPADRPTLDLWNRAVANRDVGLYLKTQERIFQLLAKRNREAVLKKYYLRSFAHFFHSVPRFIIRRFKKFPKNFLK